ncbi:hypothetical protein GQ457_02G043190 [Hibiscus cannabinus]
MDSRREIPKCNRELDVDLRTSWNNANPGRRIFDCSKYGVGQNQKNGRGKKKERMCWIACLAMCVLTLWVFM